jgi:hypothetical protein
MQIGSQAHKELFCRTFFEGHRRYEPPELPWPELDDEQLALLRSLPFWTHALQFESDAGPMIQSVAAREGDALIREALELQAYEETRHAALVRHGIGLYQLPHQEAKIEPVLDPVAEFIDFGFEECLDSFGAFGLFKLARDAEIVPDPLFEVFDNVMREEAHHIVFFINWYAHREASRGGAARWLRGPRALWHYGKALGQIAELVRGDGVEEGADFIVKGAEAFVEDLTPRLVVRTCLEENERRLAGFDRRLIVPRLIPRLARLANAALRLVPARGPRPPAPRASAAAGSESPASRAA